MENLKSIDVSIFEWINSGIDSEWLDLALPYLSHLHTMPLFKFGILPLVIGVWVYFRKKEALKVFLCLVVTVALSDMFAYRVLKPSIGRVRPNNQQEFPVKLRIYGPKSHSFPSNHATNGFAAATTLSFFYPTWAFFYFGIAGVVALSRIYGGVHFPSDILGGALLGFLISQLLIRFIFRRFNH